MKRFLLMFIISTGWVNAQAQGFLAKANLPTVEKSGFYKVNIDPSLSRHLEQGFANLRIINDAGEQVPYLLEADGEIDEDEFVNYDFETEVTRDCCTRIIITNEEEKSINNILIRFRNADVVKTAVLSGSDDKKFWYALKDVFTLDAIRNDHETSEVKVVDFPLANYRYYQLIINDSTSAPLNVVSVGYYKHYTSNAAFHPLRNFKLQIRDSAATRATHLRISFPDPEWIDEVSIKGRSKQFYLRTVNYGIVTESMKKKRMHAVRQYLGSSQISHEAHSRLPFEVKAKELFVEIQNEDNPSIKEFDVEVKQVKRKAIVWLEAGKEYFIAVGKSTLAAPKYDLGNFKTRIPHQMKEISPVGLMFQDSTADDFSENENDFRNNLLLWGGIIGIILFLSVMSLRMVREVKTKS